MNASGNPSRRRVLQAGVTGIGMAALSSLETPAIAAPAHRADTRRLTFTGATNASVAVSPVNGALIAEVQGVLWSVPRAGGEATALTAVDLEPTRVVWAPDGSRIALCAYRGGGFGLWTMRPDGSELLQVTSGPWDDRGVSWSTDGSRLAFASERGGDPVGGTSYAIWTVDVRSGELTQITRQPGVDDYDPAWHPDGSLVFVRAGKDGGRTLASVPGTGGDVTVLRTVENSTLVGPAVSPDGRIAYVQIADAVPPFNATSSRLMIDGRAVSDGEDVAPHPPSWSRDGELHYFADGQLRVRRPEPGRAGGAPVTVDFTASVDAPRPVRPTKTYDFDGTAAQQVRGIHLPVLSPDGTSVAFTALNALWVMPIGGRPREVVRANRFGYVQMPSWAPDGRSVLYSYEGTGHGNGLIGVHRHWLDSGREELLAAGGRLNPVLSPDGSRLACQDSTGNLLVKDLASGEETTVVAPLGANGIPGGPSWSPDGRYIAFCDRNRLTQRFREGYNVIRVVDTRTGQWTLHQPMPHASISDRGNAGPVWSPDGTAMAFVMESALWVMPVRPDGTPAGDPHRLTDEAADHPSWSGDARTLLYESSGSLRLIGRNGTSRRNVPVPLTYRRSRPAATDVTRVHAGRLWDGTGHTVRENVDVVIRGNRIAAVEPHREGRRPGETFIDASACTVVPGLWDAHTHPWQYTYGGRQSSLMLAYGITTNVSLGGFAHEAVRIRESVAADRMAGPRLFTSGELLDGSRVSYSMGRAHRTPAGLRRSLERAVALEYDFVKTYVRAPAWLMREAGRVAHQDLGVLAGSHFLPLGSGLGHDLTTHLHATQRAEHGRSFSPTGRSYQDVRETYRGGDFKLIMTPFPALALMGADPALAQDPRVTTLMPPWDAAQVAAYSATPPGPDHLHAIEEEVGTYKDIIDHGGVVALGSDAPLTPTGLHIHLGLRALRSSGLSAFEALRTVTVVPAGLFGVDDALGTLEPGKLADLTVVDGNPFENFDDLVRTPWVMRDGIVHRQDDLLAAYTEDASAGRDSADWLEVSRQLRREPCCPQHPLT
ncbi:amidohydrolase family protein [Streptomyces sp. NPDC014676]|uniref:amidohydrolase family protein n=1 Tax=Streptomyces sp. NPDC014676 TaxID=3364879 RepID=UPI0036F795BE